MRPRIAVAPDFPVDPAMLLTDEELGNQTSGECQVRRIQLQIRAPAAADEFVDLPAGKTTVGSSPRCNVRIRQSGVQPLQCLIANEADRITVRRWAPDTLLNREPFDAATLDVGDVLSLGPVDVQIVGQSLADVETFGLTPAGDAASTWDNATVHHTTVWLGNDSPPAESAQVEQEAAQAVGPAGSGKVVMSEGAREVFRQLQSANALSRARCRKLLDALRTNRGAYRALEARIHELENQIQVGSSQSKAELRDDASTEYIARRPLNETEDWHAAEVARLTSVVAALASEKSRLAEESEALTRELPTLRGQLDVTQQRYADWDHQTHEWEKQRAERDAAEVANLPTWKPGEVSEPEAAEQNAETAEAEVEPAWQSEPTAEPPARDGNSPGWGDEPPAETPSYESNQAPNDHPSAATTPVTSELQPVEPAAEAAPEDAEQRQQVSYLERYAHLFKDEEPTAPSTPSQPQLPGSPTGADDVISRLSGGESQPGSRPPGPSAGDDEDSIEQYMAKLWQRVRGDSSPVAVPATEAAAPHAAVTSDSSCQAEAASSVDAMELKRDETPFSDLNEMVRKGPAPKALSNLAALRALANRSARRAIGVHALRKHRRDAAAKFLVASFAGITSIWLMMIAPTWYDVQFITACLALLIAAYWAGQTYSKLLEFASASDYDGPAPRIDAEQNSLQEKLPIDVDGEKR